MVTAPAHAGTVTTDGTALKDASGRTLIVRGVNLGGDSKTPAVITADPRQVSFVGRPFPLATADVHFARLAGWGLDFIRLIVPWEAIEHQGPGQYDQQYLDYIHEIVRKAGEHGITVYIDLHQDFYSRAFGGDGAPYWTSQAIGLGVDKPNESRGRGELDPGNGYYPPVSGRHGTLTMDTLFWAGDDYAPGITVQGTPIQHYLQQHYIDAACAMARRLSDLPNVAGYDTYNEPLPGYAGTQDLAAPEAMMGLMKQFIAPRSRGTVHSFDYFLAASGLNPGPQSALKADRIWQAGAQDIWRRLGVWDVVKGRPRLLKPHYFATAGGRDFDFAAHQVAFQTRFLQAIRAVAPRALVFQQWPPLGGVTGEAMALHQPNVVSEPHFYDAKALILQQYKPDQTLNFLTGKPAIGAAEVSDYYRQTLIHQRDLGLAAGHLPTIWGETGIAYNMNGRAAYRTGDFSAQEAQAKLQYAALDEMMASYTIWNYAATNSNAKGDGWLVEDLSIFSPSQQRDPGDINSGGRALKYVVRVYPRATAGTPHAFDFDPDHKVFHYTYQADPGITAPTEIFVPRYQFPRGFIVTATGGRATADEGHSLAIISDSAGMVQVTITAK